MSAAVEYVEAGLVLVPFPCGLKGPPQGSGQTGWNRIENCITSVDAASKLNGQNIGLAHAYSHTCSIDIDQYDKAEAWLEDRSINLTALQMRDDAVQIVSGRDNRAKLLYRLPLTMKPLPSKSYTDDGDVINFRCGTSNGTTVQDVLPPSIHPDTGKPYEWHGDWRNIPVIPQALLNVWISLIGDNGKRGTPSEAPDDWIPVDLESLNITDHTRALIQYGSAGKQDGADRSVTIFGALKDLIKAEVDDDTICRVMVDPDNAISEKSLEKSHGDLRKAMRWIAPQIGNAREAVAKDQEQRKTGKSVEWDDPAPLDVYDLPAWPEDAFPEIGGFVTSVTTSVEVPLEVTFMDTLAACAAAVQGKYVIEIKPGYVEPLNIWTMPIQPPATRKTKVKTETMFPLVEWETESYNALNDDIHKNQSERKTLLKRIEAKRAQAAKAKTDVEYRNLSREVAELEQSVPSEITAPRLWTEDVTPETLGTLMSQNQERMAILSAEGGIFGIMAGRYSNGAPNIDIFLKGHAGEPVRVDRGSRNPVYMDSPCLTVGLSVQPEVLHGISQTREFRGRGLLGRFLYVYPANILGRRTGNTKPVDRSQQAIYSGRIKALLNKDQARDERGRPVASIISLSSEACTVWRDFWSEIEGKLSDHGELAHIRDWGGKLPGAVARIAGIFHCIRHATVEVERHNVSVKDMTAAVEVGRVLIQHALKVFDAMQLDETHRNARDVLAWIRRESLTEFTGRDCYRHLHSRVKRKAELDPVFEILESTGWIRERSQKQSPQGGRPSIVYDVNPAAL